MLFFDFVDFVVVVVLFFVVFVVFVVDVFVCVDVLVVMVGVGIGVDFGLFDFCGMDGFWCVYLVLCYECFEFYEIVLLYVFCVCVLFVWGFYGYCFVFYCVMVLYVGFVILCCWIDVMLNGGFVLMSNVDG